MLSDCFTIFVFNLIYLFFCEPNQNNRISLFHNKKNQKHVSPNYPEYYFVFFVWDIKNTTIQHNFRCVWQRDPCKDLVQQEGYRFDSNGRVRSSTIGYLVSRSDSSLWQNLTRCDIQVSGRSNAQRGSSGEFFVFSTFNVCVLSWSGFKLKIFFDFFLK